MQQQKQKNRLASKNKKNTYKFHLGNNLNKQIVITSNFDSGNIELIKQISQFNYRLAAVSDYITSNRSKKTWFYFKMKAFKFFKVKLMIQNVEVLNPAYQWELQTQFPVIKIGQQGKWNRIKDCYLSMREQLQIYIDFTFMSQQYVYFAMTIPYTYYDNICYIQNLGQKNQKSSIYYKKQIMTHSRGGLIVHLLTITQKQHNQNNEYQQKFDSKLFINQDIRPIKFNKPVILITCRVHPGQISGSHTLVGMIQFLFHQTDLRAYLLRKFFVFMIVPMVNPDGVYAGNYRMDTFSRNLNRLYLNPIFQNQPEIYSIKSLVEYLNQQQRLFFYFDIHGHSSAKGAFIYGNALDDIVQQTESQVFCKALELNTKFFDYEASNFSEQQMMSKDKDQPLSKEGCSRVVFHKMTNIIHSLTLEVGLNIVTKQTQQEQLSYSNTKFKYKHFGLVKTQSQDSQIIKMYYQIGRSVLITILDILDKNPYTVLANTQYKSIENLRRVLGTSILQNQQRFRRLDTKAYQKVKTIDKIIQQCLIDKISTRWRLDKQFINYNWPVAGLKNLKNLKMYSPNKKRKQIKEISKKMTYQKSELPEIELILPKRMNSEDKQEIIKYKQITLSKSIQPRENQRALMIKQLQLPKILHNSKFNQNDYGRLFLKKRKQKIKTETQKQKILIDINGKQQFSKKKFSILDQIVKTAEIEVGKLSEANKNLTNIIKIISQENEYEIQNTNSINAKNPEMNNQIESAQYLNQTNNKKQNLTKEKSNQIKSQSYKLISKEIFQTQPSERQTLIDHIFHKENQRYQKILAENQEDESSNQRNIRFTKRQLINSKLNQLKKRQNRNSESKFPEIKRIITDMIDSRNEETKIKTKRVNIINYNPQGI